MNYIFQKKENGYSLGNASSWFLNRTLQLFMEWILSLSEDL